MLELRHLRYFVAVADELHFSRAASRLNIAAATLSHQIQALERILGVQLFARKTRSAVALTHAGKRFLDEARATLRQADNAALMVRRAARGDIGTVAIGYVFAMSCTGLLPNTIARFRSTHPEATFQIQRMEPLPQYKAILDGRIDIGFTREPEHYPAALSGFLVDRLPLWLAIPKGHPLARLKRMTPEVLAGEKYVSTAPEMEVGTWGNIAAAMSQQSEPRIVAHASDVFSVLTLVSAGLGISIVSEAMLKLGVPGIVFRRLPAGSRQADFAAVFRTNEDAPVVRAFIQLLRSRAYTARTLTSAA